MFDHMLNDSLLPVITTDDGLETNLHAIAEQICSRPPGPPCSIQLTMDHETTASPTDLEFELVSNFSMICMHLLFGPSATPCDLSEADLQRLQAYINSIGYVLHVDKEEIETEYIFHISFERYGQTPPTHNPWEHLRKHMA
uniref:Uncharacterized protein n=1 Tax=viral metagenome TaxID=1070528 RepID=A0A6C0BJK9_9ZZZZ